MAKLVLTSLAYWAFVTLKSNGKHKLHGLGATEGEATVNGKANGSTNDAVLCYRLPLNPTQWRKAATGEIVNFEHKDGILSAYDGVTDQLTPYGQPARIT